jgi:hypothetical protein
MLGLLGEPGGTPVQGAVIWEGEQDEEIHLQAAEGRVCEDLGLGEI